MLLQITYCKGYQLSTQQTAVIDSKKTGLFPEKMG
jgi:hypothetical protein